MKPNKKLIQSEINKSKKLMEDMAILNKNDLNQNWSASYHINKKKGLAPFMRNGYHLEPGTKPDGTMRNQSTNYSIKNAIYMTPEQAEELNIIGEQIRNLIAQYNEKTQQYAKS